MCHSRRPVPRAPAEPSPHTTPHRAQPPIPGRRLRTPRHACRFRPCAGTTLRPRRTPRRCAGERPALTPRRLPRSPVRARPARGRSPAPRPGTAGADPGGRAPRGAGCARWWRRRERTARGGRALLPQPAVIWSAPTSPKVGMPSTAAAMTTLRTAAGSAPRRTARVCSAGPSARRRTDPSGLSGAPWKRKSSSQETCSSSSTRKATRSTSQVVRCAHVAGRCQTAEGCWSGRSMTLPRGTTSGPRRPATQRGRGAGVGAPPPPTTTARRGECLMPTPPGPAPRSQPAAACREPVEDDAGSGSSEDDAGAGTSPASPAGHPACWAGIRRTHSMR